MPPYMLEPYMFKPVVHWWSGRRGLVIAWYYEGWKAGKMWILFEDKEVELRWIDAFVDDDSMAAFNGCVMRSIHDRKDRSKGRKGRSKGRGRNL